MSFEKNGITEGTSWDTLRIYFQKNVWIVLVMIIEIPLLTKHSFIKSVLAKLCLKLCCFWFWCWYWPCCSSTLCCLHWLLSMSCMGVNITWSVTPSIALFFLHCQHKHNETWMTLKQALIPFSSERQALKLWEEQQDYPLLEVVWNLHKKWN